MHRSGSASTPHPPAPAAASPAAPARAQAAPGYSCDRADGRAPDAVARSAPHAPPRRQQHRQATDGQVHQPTCLTSAWAPALTAPSIPRRSDPAPACSCLPACQAGRSISGASATARHRTTGLRRANNSAHWRPASAGPPAASLQKACLPARQTWHQRGRTTATKSLTAYALPTRSWPASARPLHRRSTAQRHGRHGTRSCARDDASISRSPGHRVGPPTPPDATLIVRSAYRHCAARRPMSLPVVWPAANAGQHAFPRHAPARAQ